MAPGSRSRAPRVPTSGAAVGRAGGRGALRFGAGRGLSRRGRQAGEEGDGESLINCKLTSPFLAQAAV